LIRLDRWPSSCAILGAILHDPLSLGPATEEADDYSESLIFHTINSTALPLEFEHALKLILGQHSDYDMAPDKEFAFSPDLHFTRLLRDGLLKLPEPAQTRLGPRPLTSLRSAVCGLLDTDPTIAKDVATLTKYSNVLLAALNDAVTLLEGGQPALCKSEFFTELAARVWKSTPEGDQHKKRVAQAVSYLRQLAGWLGNDGLVELKEGRSLSSLETRRCPAVQSCQSQLQHWGDSGGGPQRPRTRKFEQRW